MEKQKNVPALRFHEFDGEWEIKHIGNITKKVGSGSTPLGGEKSYQKNGVIFIRSQNINHDILNLNDVVYISEELNEKMSGSKVSAGDILINITGASIGRSCVVPNDFEIGNVNQHVSIIRLTEEYCANFLQPFLSSERGQKLVFQEQAGGGREGLNFQNIRSFRIYFPFLPEQQKIASFFTAIDQKISHLKRKKDLLEQYKKGVMQQIFSQEIRFKNDNGQEFAKWEQNKLGELTVRNQTKNKKKEITIALTNSASSGIVLQRDFFDKDIANQNNLLNYYIVDKDDFVYNPRISALAPVGPIKRNLICQGVMSPLYSVFRFTIGVIDFFEYFFSTTKWHRYMYGIANYGARSDRMNITTNEFYEMPIPYPCIEEQTKIANFLSAIDDKINHTQKQIEKAETWKKGLLQQMFV